MKLISLGPVIEFNQLKEYYAHQKMLLISRIN